jgi:hypothetical protein
MAQVGALLREFVLEELLTGEMLEIRVVDPAPAYAFVGEALDVLEQPASCTSSCFRLMI